MTPIAPTLQAFFTDRLIKQLHASPRTIASYRVADGEHDGWLLPGRKRGTHITAEHLRKRLAPHGITSRPGRHGALLALAGRLPAPILVERLGIHQARAAQWARAAGATYAPYVRLRAERSARHG